MAGLTSELKFGKRNGCDQRRSSDIGEDNSRCDGVGLPLRLKDEMELIAAFLSA